MTEQDLQAMIDALEKVRAERAGSQEQARQLLKDEGVLDESGEIAERYAVPSSNEAPRLFA